MEKATKENGICDMLDSDDSVMIDCGFKLQDYLPESISLNAPPFLNGKPQLSLNKENETREITSVHVHIERAIEIVKKINILQSIFSLSTAQELNIIWVICNYFVSFLPQLAPDKETD